MKDRRTPSVRPPLWLATLLLLGVLLGISLQAKGDEPAKASPSLAGQKVQAEAALRQARAWQAEAQAALENAELTLREAKDEATKSVARQTLELAKQAKAQADKRVAEAQHALKRLSQVPFVRDCSEIQKCSDRCACQYDNCASACRDGDITCVNKCIKNWNDCTDLCAKGRKP